MTKKEEISVCFDDDFEDEFLTEPVPGGSRIVASLRPSPRAGDRYTTPMVAPGARRSVSVSIQLIRSLLQVQNHKQEVFNQHQVPAGKENKKELQLQIDFS